MVLLHGFIKKNQQNPKGGSGFSKKPDEGHQKWLRNNRHIGSSFDDFLDSEGMLDDACEVAASRVVAFKLEQRRQERGVSITELARSMGTSRSVVNNMLDANSDRKTVKNPKRGAEALGARIVMDLENI